MDNEQWTDIKQSVRARYPDVPWVDVFTEPVWYGRSPSRIDRTRIAGRTAIIGSPPGNDEEIVYCIASGQYQIVRPELAQHLFEQSLLGYEEYGTPKMTIKSLLGGARWLHEAHFPESVAINGEKVTPNACQKNSLDLGWEYSNMFGAFRVICTNGMIAGHIESQSRAKHRLNLDVEAQVGKLRDGMEKMSEQFGIWSAWAKKKIDILNAEEFLIAIPSVSENQREKILELPLIGGDNRSAQNLARDGKLNVWELHNAVTQFFTHEVEETVSGIDRNERIAVGFNREALKIAS